MAGLAIESDLVLYTRGVRCTTASAASPIVRHESVYGRPEG